MPLTRSIADAIGVVTISLVAILILAGLLCIIYSFYFRSRIRSQGFIQLSYFTGPWIIRITFILFTIWWGLGEIIRLDFLRSKGRVLSSINSKWPETVCKGYIVSNLGFAEPCLCLTLVFLLRASLQKMNSGTFSQKWNGKTAGYVLLFCLPLFVLQLIVVVIGSEMDNESIHRPKGLPIYFTSTTSTAAKPRNSDIALCTYPLLSIILLGLFVTVLTIYLFWLGRRILKLVINKGLQRRIYTLILSISSFLPLRVILLGLSLLSSPGKPIFEALSFLAFLALLCCAGVCICMLVYYPVADSLALGSLQNLEARMRDDGQNETMSLMANQSLFEEEESTQCSSDDSTKRGSISFRTMEKGGSSTGAFVELSLFSPSRHGTPIGSPHVSHTLGWPMRSSAQDDEP